MVSDSDDDERKGDGCLRCLQIGVFIYGIVNIIVRGAELLLAIIATSVIVAAYVTGVSQPSSFQDYLSVEAKHAIWRGPYPNLLMDLHLPAQNVTDLKSGVGSGNVGITTAIPVLIALPNVTITTPASIIANTTAPNVKIENTIAPKIEIGAAAAVSLGVKINATAPGVKINATAPDAKINATAPGIKINATTPDVKINAAALNGKINATALNGKINATAPEVKINATVPEVKITTIAPNIDVGVKAPAASLNAAALTAPDAPAPPAVPAVPAVPAAAIRSIPGLDNAIQDKINLYVWSSYFLMKCITFMFAWLLVVSVKKYNFSGNLAWLAYSTPILAQYVLQLVLDLSLCDYFHRELPSQIWQGVDTGFQFVGILLVSIFLQRLYHMDEKIPGIDRYNGFPSSRSNNGDISITEIIEDDQRFKL